jgi:nickel/cobalt transporter (NicO) family protein
MTSPRRTRATRLALLTFGLLLLQPNSAQAHPLGNFTTNTAIKAVVSAQSISITYVVDFAEIPTLKIRQNLGVTTAQKAAGVTSDPSPEVTNAWAATECANLHAGLEVRSELQRVHVVTSSSRAQFAPGQAGLSTLRVECIGEGALVPTPTAKPEFTIADNNFDDRLGWREITVSGNEVVIDGDVEAVSPTALLTRFDSTATSSPRQDRRVAFSTHPGSLKAASNLSVAAPAKAPAAFRGNDDLTSRFQGLIARSEVTPMFTIGAVLLAMVLGALHAVAPGHGKTIMAAYAVSRRGSRRDMLSIGATVALTHTIGIVLLGTIVSATSAVSPDRALRWASVISGALVVGVGLTLVRGRLITLSSRRLARSHDHPHPHPHPRPHGHDDHHHDHPHDHPHDHSHQDHPRSLVDERFIVTSHRHGGWAHDHVLPAPGVTVKRSELITMGLAGGLAPSPSALVVLLAGVALGRVALGLTLVIAYGIGLAATLIGIGLLLVRFEGRVRRWTTGRTSLAGQRVQQAYVVMPLLSGLTIVGAGCLLLLRSLSAL